MAHPGFGAALGLFGRLLQAPILVLIIGKASLAQIRQMLVMSVHSYSPAIISMDIFQIQLVI